MKTSSAWNTFVVRIPVNAIISNLYTAWTTSAGIESWFLRSAVYRDKTGEIRKRGEYIQPGDMYHWLWHGYTDDVFEKRKVLQANGSDLLQFEFTGNCIVTVTIADKGPQSLVTLQQERIPDDENPATNLFVNCQLGWTFYLANLKSVMEGGLDLRNRDLSMQHVINA